MSTSTIKGRLFVLNLQQVTCIEYLVSKSRWNLIHMKYIWHAKYWQVPSMLLFCLPYKLILRIFWCTQSRGLGKLGRQGAICWLKQRTIQGTCYTSYFYRNTFFVCQDRELKFSTFVWFRILQKLIQTNIFRWHFSMGNKSCLDELKFCEVP